MPLHTLAEVAAAELAYSTEALWKTMTQGRTQAICWAAEDALSRIEKARRVAA